MNLTSPARLALLIGLVVTCQTHGNILVVTRGTVQAGTVVPQDNTDVRVLKEKLTIDVGEIENASSAPTVDVAAEYTLKNDSDRDQTLSIAFPFVGAFQPTARGLSPVAKPPKEDPRYGTTVTLDGKSLPAKTDVLPLPYVARTPYPTLQRPAPDDEKRWTAAWQAWVDRDQKVKDLLDQYSRQAMDHQAYNDAQQQFQAAAETILGRRELEYRLKDYLDARSAGRSVDTVSLRELIAEADPTLRRVQGNSYLSAVPYDTKFTPDLVKTYCSKIDAWIDGTPDVRVAHQRFADQIKINEDANRLLTDRLRPYLKKSRHLDKPTLARLIAFVRDAYNPSRPGYVAMKVVDGKVIPDRETKPARAATLPAFAPGLWLVAQLDPAIEAERQDRIKQADAMLTSYGFDSTYLSPLTGRGYSKRVGWRDDSTWKALGMESPRDRDEGWLLNSSSNLNDATIVTAPASEARVIRFDVKLDPGQTRTLRVSYRTLAEVDDFLTGSVATEQLIHVRYILTTTKRWKSFGEIDVTVSMPAKGLAVLDPAPVSVSAESGRRIFHSTIKDPDRNLRLAWLPTGDQRTSELAQRLKPTDQPDLEKLLRLEGLPPDARKVLETLLGFAKAKGP